MVGIILNYFQIIITLITGENHNSLNVWLVNYNCRLLSSPFLPFAVLKWMGKQTDGTQKKNGEDTDILFYYSIRFA